MYCENCGCKIENGKFCPQCGNIVKNKKIGIYYIFFGITFFVLLFFAIVFVYNNYQNKEKNRRTKYIENNFEKEKTYEDSGALKEKNESNKNEMNNDNTSKSKGEETTANNIETSISNVETQISNISDEYKKALIAPKIDPVEAWDGIEVKEIAGSNGIHFYVPMEWEVEENINGVSISYYFGDSFDYSIETTCCRYTEDYTPFDWDQFTKPNEIGEMNYNHYFFNMHCYVDMNSDYWPDPYAVFDEKIANDEIFCKILNTVWVEEKDLVIKDINDVRDKIVAHYQRVCNPIGNFVCFDTEDIYDYFDLGAYGCRITIRYQVEDGEELINPIADSNASNIFCFYVDVNYENGNITMYDPYEWDGYYEAVDWNINDE